MEIIMRLQDPHLSLHAGRTHLTGQVGFARRRSAGGAQHLGLDSALLGNLQPELRAGQRARQWWCRCALLS